MPRRRLRERPEPWPTGRTATEHRTRPDACIWSTPPTYTTHTSFHATRERADVAAKAIAGAFVVDCAKSCKWEASDDFDEDEDL